MILTAQYVRITWTNT